jgi:hypothetical protein
MPVICIVCAISFFTCVPAILFWDTESPKQEVMLQVNKALAEINESINELANLLDIVPPARSPTSEHHITSAPPTTGPGAMLPISEQGSSAHSMNAVIAGRLHGGKHGLLEGHTKVRTFLVVRRKVSSLTYTVPA